MNFSNMLNRKTAPEITDAVKFQLNLPPHQKISLRNGVEVYLVDMGTVDTLMMNVVFYAGNCFESENLVAAAIPSNLFPPQHRIWKRLFSCRRDFRKNLQISGRTRLDRKSLAGRLGANLVGLANLRFRPRIQ